MTDTPAQAPADPGAIDIVVELRRRAKSSLSDIAPSNVVKANIFNRAAAAVEALRERVAELEGEPEIVGMGRRPDTKKLAAVTIRDQGIFTRFIPAEAAETRCAELAGALAHLIEFADQTGQGNAKQQKSARAALAATPEKPKP